MMIKRKLGFMETAQAFTNESLPFNAVVVLRLTHGPGEETLRQAMAALQLRQPLLAARIRKEKRRYFFESPVEGAIPINMVIRQNNEQWRQVVEEELNTILDFEKGPLARLVYIANPDNQKESEIIITFHHAVVDAASGTSLAHELLSLCESFSAEELKSLELMPPAEDFFPPAFKGIRRKWSNFRFVLCQMGDEFLYRLRSGSCRKAPIYATGRGRILPMKLSRETTDRLCKRVRRKKVTLNSLFSAAIMTAVHKHIYDGKATPFRNFSFADLRPYLEPPLADQYLGSYISMMRFTIPMRENPEIWELASEVNDILYTSVKRGDKFCFNMLSAPMMKATLRLKAFRMGTTAVSYTGPVKLARQYGKIELKDVHAFVSNFVLGPEYTAAVRLFAGQFYWDILYLDSDMDGEKANVLADEIKNILEAAVKGED